MADWAVPDGLEAGGLALWHGIVEAHELDVMQVVQLTEACRAKDRLDRLDGMLRERCDTWMVLRHSALTHDYKLVIQDAARLSISTADTMKKLLNALRLPDESGRRPQRRGPRGVQAPSVSSLDRARARARTRGR